MKKRKILYISGTRADYGLMRQALFAIKKHPKLSLDIIACGMHVMPEFGRTVKEIKKDGFKPITVNAVYEKDSKASTAKFLGESIQLFVEKIEKIKPDIILLLGDRAEMLAAASVGAYLGIPVAHIHGGDVSSTVDDVIRNTITKLANIHFPATRKSADRILKMGEESWRLHVTGAPGLDALASSGYANANAVVKKYKLSISKPILLVVQHPVTFEISQAAAQMKATLSAVGECKGQTIVVYPNADAGSRKMIEVIESYRKVPGIKVYKNIPREDYIGLLSIASVMIGNSSGGIIETASFHVPAINIGTRQEGRERAGNIIDADYKKESIKKAIEKALHDKRFLEKVKIVKSPYGDGKAGQKIATILASVPIDEKLLNKKTV